MYSIILAASISAVVAVAIYAVVTNLVIKTSIRKRREAAVKEAEAEGEMIKKERILQAKEKFIQLKSEYDRQVNERNQKIAQSEQRAKQIEQNLQNQQRELENKLRENDRLKEQMQNQLQILEHKKEEVDQMQREQNARLEQISGMSSEDAKNILIENMKAEAKTEAAAYINETVEEAKLTATKEAKRIIVASIQRVATETAIENAVTVFNIESDEVKGRIIGREGRNIRALEAATGIEIIVDDTPEAIILSGFDPVRREIARLALHQLVTDGRIHPARIEEVVAKVQKQIEEEIVEVGKRTTIDLGIHGLHPELIRMIGKMKYRSSYGQNLLQHARETANLAGIMASELGLNPKIARRAGLLHDIGKVPDDEPELPHAIIGMKLAEKFKEKPEVCNAIGAHHDEVEMTSQGAGDPLDAFAEVEARRACLLWGNTRVRTCAADREELGGIRNEDYATFKYLDFGDGADTFSVTVTLHAGGRIEVLTDNLWSAPVGTVEVPAAEGASRSVTLTVPVRPVDGVRSVTLRFLGDKEAGELFTVDSFRFGKKR